MTTLRLESLKISFVCSISPEPLPSCHPEEKETIILQNRNVEFPHLVICECSVWKLHVDVPRWVCHHHRKLPQDGDIQITDITANPLSLGRGHIWTSTNIYCWIYNEYSLWILVLDAMRWNGVEQVGGFDTCEGNSLPTLLSPSVECSPSSIAPACGPAVSPSASGGLSIS